MKILLIITLCFLSFVPLFWLFYYVNMKAQIMFFKNELIYLIRFLESDYPATEENYQEVKRIIEKLIYLNIESEGLIEAYKLYLEKYRGFIQMEKAV